MQEMKKIAIKHIEKKGKMTEVPPYDFKYKWLNSTIKRQLLAEWINIIQLYAVYKRLTLGPKTQTGWKWRHGKKIFHSYKNQENRSAIPISDKIDFKSKKVTKDKKDIIY